MAYTYSERIARYMEAHPGATKAEARGHGETPERPGGGKQNERFTGYYERRERLESHTNELKRQAFGNEPKYNAESAAYGTSKIPIGQLEKASGYDSLDSFFEDYPENEVDDNFGYYH